MCMQCSFFNTFATPILRLRSAYATPMLQKWEKCALPRSFLTLRATPSAATAAFVNPYIPSFLACPLLCKRACSRSKMKIHFTFYSLNRSLATNCQKSARQEVKQFDTRPIGRQLSCVEVRAAKPPWACRTYASRLTFGFSCSRSA